MLKADRPSKACPAGLVQQHEPATRQPPGHVISIPLLPLESSDHHPDIVGGHTSRGVPSLGIRASLSTQTAAL